MALKNNIFNTREEDFECHSMLYEFYKGNICAIYLCAVTVIKCWQMFSKFKTVTDLFNKPHSGRPTALDNCLKTSDVNPCQNKRWSKKAQRIMFNYLNMSSKLKKIPHNLISLPREMGITFSHLQQPAE